MTRVELPKVLVDQLEVLPALHRALEHPPELLPVSPIDRVVADREEEAAAYLGELFRSGLAVDIAELLWARKPETGNRPVTILSLPERVLLEALVGVLEPHLPPMRRSQLDYAAFQAGPADNCPDDGYVVFADVSAFYDYVDHQLLHDELVAQTGESQAASALQELLGELMGRRFGIPQGYRASDVLSEVVIDIVERRLLRRGIAVWRYVDDFRMVAQDWRSARRLIEVFAEELRRLGLHPNEAKTYPMGIAKYRDWLEQPGRVWSEITEGAEVDLRQVNLYDPAPATPTAVLEAAAIQALTQWREYANANESATGVERSTYRKLLSIALAVLRGLRSFGGLEYIRDLLQYEGWLSIALGRYLAALAETDAIVVSASLETVVHDHGLYLSDWQSLWLLEVPLRGEVSTDGLTQWMRHLVDSDNPSSLLRARAAHALALTQGISANEAIRIYETIDEASAPDAIASIARSASNDEQQILNAIRRESPLVRWIVDGVAP